MALSVCLTPLAHVFCIMGPYSVCNKFEMRLYFLPASKNESCVFSGYEMAIFCVYPRCCDPADSRRPMQPLHDVLLRPQVGAGAPRSVGQPNAGEVILLEVWPKHSADRAAALGPPS